MRSPSLALIAVCFVVSCKAEIGPSADSVASTGGNGGVGAGGAPTGGAPPIGGAAAGTGGSSMASSGGATGTGTGGTSNGPLTDRISTSDVVTPAGVIAGGDNWRIWGRDDLVVGRVFTVPLANCQTLVCYTTGGGSVRARVAHLDTDDRLITTIDLDEGRECRGLAAEPDGHFAALLWDDPGDRIFVKRYDLAGSELWERELVNSDNRPDDFGIGESRLEYGNGRYGAYYHVHSDSGHEGDSLKWVDAASGTESTEWDWGCSHSMSNLLRFHPAALEFLPVCVTDCYPGTRGDLDTDSKGGIYLDHDVHVMDVAAGCNGRAAGELGGLAFSDSGYQLVFNAHQAPTVLGQSSYDEDTMNQDIGLVGIGAEGLQVGSIVWLTNTPSIDEADATIERWMPAGETGEQYVVGWVEPSGGSREYRLSRIDAAGTFLEGPLAVGAIARWGRRDDPFRRHQNGDAIWSWFDDEGSTTLHVARLRSGNAPVCESF